MNLSPDKPLVIQEGVRKNRNERFLQTDHLRYGLQGRSFRGGVVTLGGQAIKFVLGMVSTAALARLLRPQDFGLVAMVTSITSFVGLFRDLGLSNATVQRAHVTHAQVSFLFWVNVSLSVMVALIVLALAPVIAWFYHEPRLVWVTSALSGIFIFSGLTVQHQALLRRQMKFKALAVRDVVALACGISVGITLAWFGFGYWSLVGVLFVTSVTNCVLVWTICDWRPGPFRRGVGARGMLAFGGNLTAFNILNYFSRNFDNILVGRVLGAAPLGIYSKAYGLLMLPIAQINMPLASVMLPSLSRLQNEPSEYAGLFVRAVRSIALMTVPIVVFSLFFSQDIVLVLLGRKWLSVAPIFQVLAPAALFEAISFAPGWLCQSLGRTRRQFHYAMVSAPVYITGFIVGIRWGIAGVAVSYSITFSLLFWGYVLYATKGSPVRFWEIGRGFVSSFLPALCAGGAAGMLRWFVFVDLRPAFALLVFGLVFVSMYLGVLMLTGENRRLILSGLQSVRKTLRGQAKANLQ